MTGTVLVRLTPELESPVERAAMAVHLAVADFFLAIHDVPTNAEALKLHALISQCVLALVAAEDAAILKADALCGPKRSRDES